MGGNSSTDEKWKPIEGYESIYEVSTFGRVRSLERRVINHPSGSTRIVRARFLKLRPDGGGYLVADLCREHERWAVHVASLVAHAFIGPKPDGLEVLHGDGVRTNNLATNLRYGTRKENMADARRHGTAVCGERQWKARLKASDVEAIRASTEPSIILAYEFGVNYAHIRAIKKGQTWQHLLNR